MHCILFWVLNILSKTNIKYALFQEVLQYFYVPSFVE